MPEKDDKPSEPERREPKPNEVRDRAMRNAGTGHPKRDDDYR